MSGALSTRLEQAKSTRQLLSLTLDSRLNDLNQEVEEQRRGRRALQHTLRQHERTLQEERAQWHQAEAGYVETLKEERRQAKKVTLELKRQVGELRDSARQLHELLTLAEAKFQALEHKYQSVSNERDSLRKELLEQRAHAARLENDTIPALTLENTRLRGDLDGVRADLTDTIEAESSLWDMFFHEQQARRKRILEREGTH